MKAHTITEYRNELKKRSLHELWDMCMDQGVADEIADWHEFSKHATKADYIDLLVNPSPTCDDITKSEQRACGNGGWGD